MDRVIYWQIRALHEQSQREQLEGDLARLKAIVESGKTVARLNALFGQLKADGVLDMTVGDWRPDDAAEQFVRVTPTQEASAPPVTES